MKIVNLRTNGTRSPLGIDTKTPTFSWSLIGENEIQKNYRIKVASTEKLLFSNTPDMWDSGIVKSNETLHIPYEGKPLESCKEYFWLVETEDETSEIGVFETAFLNPEKEFVAYWIGQPLGFAGSVDDVRLDFEIDKPVKRARFYVAALGAGRFYLNGKLIADDYFDGSVSVYEKTIYYRTYKLDFKQGKNCLCAKLGYGFYGAKKMYGIMRTEFEDGTVSVTPTYPGRVWNVKRDAIRLNGVYDGETYDARCEENWLDPDYKVTFGNWVATFLADAPKGKFKANPIPPMRIVKRFAPCSVTETPSGLLVDTGVNLCGFLSLKMRGERGARVIVRHAERLRPDGELSNANYRAAECMDTYILKGEGTETYTPEFTYHGFQYAQIEIEGNVQVEDVEVCYLRSDVEESGEFRCSDEALNRLHEIAVQTEGNNLNGVFTDCPQRDERLGWLNDLSSRMFQSVCNFSLETYLGNFIDMITDQQTEEGVIPDTVPYSVGSTQADFISAYTVLGVLHYRFYKDKRVLERNYEGFCKWVAFMRKNADENGHVAQFGIYGDWCPALIYALSEEKDTFSKFVTPQFMSAIYFIWYLDQMREIAEILNKQADAMEWEHLRTAYKAKLDEKYYNEKTGLYGNGSQTDCAVALTVFPEAAECALWAKTANDDVVARGYHMTCGNQGYRHLLYNLAEYNYVDTVVKLLKNPEYPGWGYMLSRGATSVWERWEDSVNTDMHSFNHPMFSAYDGFFYNYLLGLRTWECTDAFSKIVIEPCFAEDLTFAEGKLQTVRGEISISWERIGAEIRLRISTPANTTLTVRAKGYILAVDGKENKDTATFVNGTFEISVLRYYKTL